MTRASVRLGVLTSEVPGCATLRTDLNEIVRRVAQFLEGIAGPKTSIHMDFTGEIETLGAVPELVEDALLNLALNAIEASALVKRP